MKQSQYITLIAASAVLGLGVFEVEPSQAAKFSWTLNDEYGSGEGYLEFEDSPLTGKGRETISLDDLIGYSESNSIYYEYYTVYSQNFRLLPRSGDLANIFLYANELTFESGKLIGINFYENSDGYEEIISTRLALLTYNELISVSGAGNEYLATWKGSLDIYSCEYILPEYDEGGRYECGNEYRNYGPIQTIGKIEFTTIEPIESIPEPITILGAGTALGFGTLFKRKLTQKDNNTNRIKS